MADTGGRKNERGAYNEDPNSIMAQLAKLPPEMRDRYYKNRRAYYAAFAAFETWASMGCQMSEQFDYTEEVSDAEDSWE